MTTTAQPLIGVPVGSPIVEFAPAADNGDRDRGRPKPQRVTPTIEYQRFFELMGYEMSKVKESALGYTALDPTTATAATIATALNTFMAGITET